jgi:serine/threonine protein kinase
MLQILDAIHELHSQGIVHRDLKLENILLSENGEVKVTDLGLMKRTDSHKRTRPGLILGTAQYMPPEYVKKGEFDTRGDIYALGVILLELLSRKRRLETVPDNKALEFLIKRKFIIDEQLFLGVSEGYRKIISKATAVNPAERYQSVLELRFDIIAHRASGGVGFTSSDSVSQGKEVGSSRLLRWNRRESRHNQLALYTTVSVLSMCIVLLMGISSGLLGKRHINLGVYTGEIILSGSHPLSVSFESQGGTLFLDSKELGCSRAALDVSRMQYSCDGGNYILDIEGQSDSSIRGYMIRLGSGRILEFAAKRG